MNKKSIITLLMVLILASPFTLSAIGGAIDGTSQPAVRDVDTVWEKVMEEAKVEQSVALTMEAIRNARLEGNNERAKALLHKVIKSDPTYAPAYYYMSQVRHDSLEYFAKKAYDLDTLNKWYLERYAKEICNNYRYNEAVPYYEKLIELDEENNNALVTLAYIYIYVDRYEEALETFEKWGNKTGSITDVTRIKLAIYTEIGDRKRAIESAQTLSNLQDHDAESRYTIAALLFRVGAPDSLVVEQLVEAGKLHGGAPKVSDEVMEGADESLKFANEVEGYLMQTESWIRPKVSDIQEDVTRIIPILSDPKVSAGFKYMMLLTMVNNGHIVNAHLNDIVLISTTAYTQHPDSKGITAIYTELLAHIGEMERCLHVATESLRLQIAAGEQPEYYDFLRVINLASHTNNPEIGDSTSRKAVEYYADSTHLYTFPAQLYMIAKQNEKALESMEWTERMVAQRYAKDKEMRANVYCTYGDLYQVVAEDKESEEEQTEYYKKSIAEYKKALKLSPKFALALNNCAYTYTKFEATKKELKQAKKMAEKAMELEPNSPINMDTYAMVLYSMGEYAEAKSVMEVAVPLMGNDPQGEILFNYARILAALGERFMAEIYFERAQNLGYSKEKVQEQINKLKK